MSQKNMSVFKEAWAENVSLLTDSVDAISSLVEFMSVIGNYRMYTQKNNVSIII